MFEPILSQLASLSIPVPVTLACACVCAYMLGKIPKDIQEKKEQSAAKQAQAPAVDLLVSEERPQSDKLIHKLTAEVEDFHRDLEVHSDRLQQLQLAIAKLEQGDDVDLADEATQTLRSIERYCDELPRMFNAIRQTTKSAVDSVTTATVNS